MSVPQGPWVGEAESWAPEAPIREWRLDVHVHLAGVPGDGQGFWISPTMRRSVQFAFMRRMIGIDLRDPAKANQAYADRVVALAESSQELDGIGLLAMDGAYDAQGRLDPAKSHLVVPNEAVRALGLRSPRILPFASVNPGRADALEALEAVAPWAVALKWLPPLQRFSPNDPRFAAFLDRLAELELPVLAHAGPEHTFPGMAQKLGDVLMLKPLAERGIPLIVAHCATGSPFAPGCDHLGALGVLAGEHACVHADVSAFSTPARMGAMARVLREPNLVGRLLQGSDWPVPANAWIFAPQLGLKEAKRLAGIRHPWDRDVAIKRALGLPQQAFVEAGRFLAKRLAIWARYRAEHLPEAGDALSDEALDEVSGGRRGLPGHNASLGQKRMDQWRSS